MLVSCHDNHLSDVMPDTKHCQRFILILCRSIELKIKANLLSFTVHRMPNSCALIMMITTLLTLIKLKLKTHLAEISFHYHEKMSLEYLAIANQKFRSIFYKLEDFIHRQLGTFMICIDIFKRFQIVTTIDGIFNILKNMFQ